MRQHRALNAGIVLSCRIWQSRQQPGRVPCVRCGSGRASPPQAVLHVAMLAVPPHATRLLCMAPCVGTSWPYCLSATAGRTRAGRTAGVDRVWRVAAVDALLGDGEAPNLHAHVSHTHIELNILACMLCKRRAWLDLSTDQALGTAQQLPHEMVGAVVGRQRKMRVGR